MFIGREAELKFLNDKYDEDKGQLIVLYGRRRIGKTETLREFCKGKPHVFYSCTQTTDKQQLMKFSQHMLKEGLPAGRYVSQFSDWEMAFRSMMELPYGEKKRLIVIDEFPYMCRANPSIPSILQNLWDAELHSRNVMIILCGSSMSFMEKKLLSKKNPLYGRATGIYKMNEMNFYDAMKFFPDYSDEEKILTYAILGGIPHYLSQWDPKRSVADNIKRNILTKGCVLYSEVEFLLRQELREPAIYNSIIEAVAAGNTRLNDISQKAQIDDTAKTSVYLKNLIELGVIEREFSVDAGKQEKSNTGKGIYRLADNFFRFWYAFGFTNYSQLEDGDVDGVYSYVVEPALHEFGALPFEDVCRQYVRRLQRKNALPFRYEKMGRWMGKTTVRDNGAKDGLRVAETEIDLLAVGAGKKQYLVGECKFKHAPFSYSEFLDTKAKLMSQKQNAEFYYILFSLSGYDDRIREDGDADHTLLVELKDLVNPGDP